MVGVEDSHLAGDQTVRINGEIQPWRPHWTVWELLQELEADGPGVAVERNFAVVRRQNLATTPIEPGDTLEVVRLVGGG
jgi:sulfur carrier protein